MFEAVGEAYWPTYFGKVSDLLNPGGQAGLQIITIAEQLFDGYRARPDFIQHYIFPGGMLPSETRLKAGDRRGRHELDRRAPLRPRLRPHPARMGGGRSTSAGPTSAPTALMPASSACGLYYLGYCEGGFPHRPHRTDVIQLSLAKA